MGDITIVLGPPCAGKSTYVAANAQPDDVIVDFDALATTLGSSLPHQASGGAREVALAARKAAIRRILEGVDEKAWIIHTNPAPWQMSSYEAASAEFITLDPGIDTCLERAAERPEGTEEAIRAWYDAPPTIPDGKAKRKTGTMKIKTTPARVKAAGADDGLAEGQFEAIVSVFGNKDSVGDVVMPGAFVDTLAEWSAKGDPIPVIWSHDWSDPFSHLGHVEEAEERDEGLWVRGQLDLDNEKAAQVYRLLKGRRVTQFSFAYDIVEGAWVDAEDDSYYELRKLKVHEVGPCLLGANQETTLLAVKAADLAARLKAGDTIDLDALTTAHDAIGAVIEASKTSTPTGVDTPSTEAGQPDPDAANDPTGALESSAGQHSKVSPAQVAAWTTVNELLEVAT